VVAPALAGAPFTILPLWAESRGGETAT